MAVNLLNQKKDTKPMYNFKKTEVKKRVAFRLFVKYYKKSPFYNSVGPQFTYRGYFNRPDKGRGRLMHIFIDRYEDIRFAVLYNDITGDEFHQKKTIRQILKSDD